MLFTPLFASLDQVNGLVATYAPRGGGQPVNVKVVPGNSDQSRQLLPRNVNVGRNSQDWLMSLGAYQAEPIAGDRLTVYYEGGQSRVWEVNTMGTDRCWQWSGAGCNRRRIHTVEVLPDEELP